MSKRLDVLKTYKIYINGQFVRSESGHYLTLKNKSGEQLANICRSTRKDFRQAMVAARGAQGGWAGKTAYNRGQILYRMAEILEGRRVQFIHELSLEGASAKKAEAEVDACIDRLVYYAGWCDKYQQIFSTVNPVQSSHFNFSVPEPTGVVSIIADENSSLIGLISLITPVIAGGNTCVVLAGERNSLSACSFAEVIHSSDVPGGVINLLTGLKSELVSHMSSHMDVNAILYTDTDVETKKMIQENASLNIKRVFFKNASDWMDLKHENPYTILDFQEIKTTWHPVAI